MNLFKLPKNYIISDVGRELIELNRARMFWKTWAITITIFFGAIVWYVATHF